MLPETIWRHRPADRWPGLQRAEGVRPGDGHPAPTLLRDAHASLYLYRAYMLGRAGQGTAFRTEM
ncbi:hypothetical protein NE236_23035 [Actinoallomurus purpureus]|uniref:hypothetical protein n=1 Tax=Actinoallomurus purpureus TaxID=478114 RepID=UPI00209370A9|nr:hypothetical protein [Actinoallomurus purpureus]MCO6007858.1 hypothetical protein [Actinoallomurus purpureus]